MLLRDARIVIRATLHSWLSHATKSHILFPAIAVLMLAIIWSATWDLIKTEYRTAERTAVSSIGELADTYEARAVRALREIDQTLKLVKYAYELKDKQAVLQELKARELLPPELLFTITIADRKGDVVASTRPSARTNVADQNYFQRQRQTDNLLVNCQQQISGARQWELLFSRRLNAADGSFAGVVMVSVDAAYFVSGYETSNLGEHGLLGFISPDGVFLARRSGETIAVGDLATYAELTLAENGGEKEVTLTTSAWDGVRRYFKIHRLYGFPLNVVVGLSEDERMVSASRNRYTYLLRASAGSVLLILIIALLGRLSRQLELSRQREVEEQVAHTKRVEYLAFHDGLTGLPNRSLFSQLLGQSINQAHRYNRQLVVLFLDIDRFKHINDTLGHEAGDQLLQGVATRLKACLRDSDTVARLGGDEFVVLLPELDEEQYATSVAQKILSTVARPFVLLDNQGFRVTASIGISTYPQDGLDEQTLIKNADTAMYQAKQEGKNNFQFYSEKQNANSLERLTLESGLRQALERSEFQLHYQAKREIRSGRITGMEALLRWQHPDLGSVAPMRFIPVAEETGLILPIGKWVLKTACLQNVAWQKQGLPRLNMAVNLTARQFFDENLLADLMAILADTGMDAHLLELEISESLLLLDVKKTLRILTGLKDLGIRIAIDDFGIGYSSLSTLKQFPLDTIKIDRSFIRDVASVAEDKSLTKAILKLGRTLSLTVIAQGVETKEQADFLRPSACDEFQGFYFNKPIPADQMTELLRTQSAITHTDINPVT